MEKLRSVLVQLEYKYQVDYWHAQGIPFKDHLYVPEIHPDTQMMFCEREDEGHVFKVSLCVIALQYIHVQVTCTCIDLYVHHYKYTCMYMYIQHVHACTCT